MVLLIAGYVNYKKNLSRVTFPLDGTIRYLVLDKTYPGSFSSGLSYLNVLVHCYNMDLEGEHLIYEPVIFAKYFFAHVNNTSDGTINSMTIHFLSDVEDFCNVPYYHDEVNLDNVNSKMVYSIYVGQNRAPEFNVFQAKRKTPEGEIEFKVPEHILAAPVDSNKYEQINLLSWKKIKALAKAEWREYELDAASLER